MRARSIMVGGSAKATGRTVEAVSEGAVDRTVPVWRGATNKAHIVRMAATRDSAIIIHAV